MNEHIPKPKFQWMHSSWVKKYYIDKKMIDVALEDMKKLQTETGSHDDYGQGLYNGLELARVTLLKINKSKFVGLKEWKELKR